MDESVVFERRAVVVGALVIVAALGIPVRLIVWQAVQAWNVNVTQPRAAPCAAWSYA